MPESLKQETLYILAFSLMSAFNMRKPRPESQANLLICLIPLLWQSLRESAPERLAFRAFLIRFIFSLNLTEMLSPGASDLRSPTVRGGACHMHKDNSAVCPAMFTKDGLRAWHSHSEKRQDGEPRLCPMLHVCLVSQTLDAHREIVLANSFKSPKRRPSLSWTENLKP